VVLSLKKKMSVKTMQKPSIKVHNEDHPVYKAIVMRPLGLDGLPDDILNSRVFTGKDLQELARSEFIPSEASISLCANRYHLTKGRSKDYYHKRAKQLITKNKVEDAIKVALYKGC